MSGSKVKKKPKDSDPFLTFGDVRLWIKESRAMNSTDTKVAMHRCGNFDDVCVTIRLVDGHDICESEEEAQ